MVAGLANVADPSLEPFSVDSDDDRHGGVPAKHLRQHADLVASAMQDDKDSSVGQRRQRTQETINVLESNAARRSDCYEPMRGR